MATLEPPVETCMDCGRRPAALWRKGTNVAGKPAWSRLCRRCHLKRNLSDG